MEKRHVVSMIMSVPLMIRFSGGRSDVGESWLNDIRFSNAFCFQNLFLFGTHVLSNGVHFLINF